MTSAKRRRSLQYVPVVAGLLVVANTVVEVAAGVEATVMCETNSC